MRHGSLFSGIGGFDLAAEWMGWENVFHCEWNEFGQKILKHYWPKSISYGDITKTDFTIHRGRIDIITGGFPCQPYSLAGKRKGKEDERHLWPEMLRAIGEIQPSWVVGENVPGIINWSGGLVFHEVQTDLEAQGYEVFPVILPACGVNAPHRRERIWFVAHSTSERCNNGLRIRKNQTYPTLGIIGNDGITPNPQSRRINRINGNNNGTKTENGMWTSKPNSCDERIIKNSNSSRDTQSELQQTDLSSGSVRDNKQVNSNSGNKGLQRSKDGREFESIRKRKKQQPTRLLLPTWQDFPTQSPLCSRDDGLSSRLDGITFSKWRNESIKGYGNAIVPQVVLMIFKAIEDYANRDPF